MKLLKSSFYVYCFLTLASSTNVFSQKLTRVPQEFKTISEALSRSQRGDTVIVSSGIYKEQFTIPSNVTLMAEKNASVIVDGKGRGNTINMSNNSSIIGIDVTNGTAGIISKSPGVTIKNCRIYKNRGSAILCTGNLADISNCLIVFNQGSGIQAVSISGGSTIMEKNTIAYNQNTGIAIAGKTGITIKNNIISNNTSQGIKLDGLSENLCKVNNNIFFKNHKMKMDISKNNIEADPLFKEPKKKKMDFSLLPTSPAKGKAEDGTDPGFSL